MNHQLIRDDSQYAANYVELFSIIEDVCSDCSEKLDSTSSFSDNSENVEDVV